MHKIGVAFPLFSIIMNITGLYVTALNIKYLKFLICKENVINNDSRDTQMYTENYQINVIIIVHVASLNP